MQRFSLHSIRLLTLLLLLVTANAHAQFWNKKKPDLLPDEEAFTVTAQIVDQELKVFWTIAPDYYMYRDQFSTVSSNPDARFGPIDFPAGQIENDEIFGEVVVYFYNVELIAPVTSLPTDTNSIQLELKGQGCNKPVGVCYPPISRFVTVEFDPAMTTNDNSVASNSSASNDAARPALDPSENQDESNTSFWQYVVVAFFAGIGLSFTPCVLPMIPILLGVIAGQNNPSKLRAGWLASCYVAGTIVVYAIAGWVAGLSGTQLQAYFQNPVAIAVICTLLLALAAALFGAFRLELPSSIQTRISGTKVSTRSVSITTFLLGVISSLVVGACVSPVLFLSIGAAIKQGDPVLGAAIMSALALGMGLLLILVGFGAAWILPKAGAWMKHVQVLFGFMVLGVAIYIASFLAFIPALLLWAALLLWIGFYLWQISKELEHALFASAFKALALAILLWGGLSLIGASRGGEDVLNPLSEVMLGSGTAANDKIPFKTVTTLSATKTLLAQAKQSGQPTLVDFYADWCLDCKRMAKSTFREPEVHTALADWQLIEVDVTDTNQDSEELKQFFDVFGPPATLFIRADGTEAQNLRQYGYLDKQTFLALVNQVD